MAVELYLKKVLRSCYCKIVFGIFFIALYFLLPIRDFESWTYVLGLIFIALFALSLTCMVRNIKEKVKLNKQSNGSWISLIASVLGLTALQVCGFGAPVCGASLGLSFLTAIFPNFLLNFFIEYSLIILIFAILLQILSLYLLKCFVKVKIAFEINNCGVEEKKLDNKN